MMRIKQAIAVMAVMAVLMVTSAMAALAPTVAATIGWDTPGPELPHVFVRIYYGHGGSCINNEGACLNIEAPTGATEIRIAGLEKGRTYYFVAVAVDSQNGRVSDYSNEVTCNTTDVTQIQIRLQVRGVHHD